MESLGHIVDLRNQSTCPCLANYIKKPSKELKELCLAALHEQVKQLIQAEGEANCRQLCDNLKKKIADIKKIDPEKAEIESKAYVNFF